MAAKWVLVAFLGVLAVIGASVPSIMAVPTIQAAPELQAYNCPPGYSTIQCLLGQQYTSAPEGRSDTPSYEKCRLIAPFIRRPESTAQTLTQSLGYDREWSSEESFTLLWPVIALYFFVRVDVPPRYLASMAESRIREVMQRGELSPDGQSPFFTERAREGWQVCQSMGF